MPARLLRSGTVDAVCVCTPHPTPRGGRRGGGRGGRPRHSARSRWRSISARRTGWSRRPSAAGIKFGGIFQRRFWPAAQRIRAAIDDGKLGTVTHGECRVRIWRPESYFAQDAWRGKWATEGGGVLMNQAVHAIDLLQWYMGPVTEVFGRWATAARTATTSTWRTRRWRRSSARTARSRRSRPPRTTTRRSASASSVHGTPAPPRASGRCPRGARGSTTSGPSPARNRPAVTTGSEDGSPAPASPSFHRLQIQDFLQADPRRPPPGRHRGRGEEGRWRSSWRSTNRPAAACR